MERGSIKIQGKQIDGKHEKAIVDYYKRKGGWIWVTCRKSKEDSLKNGREMEGIISSKIKRCVCYKEKERE